MEPGNFVNVWLDRPGDFLEVFWSQGLSEAVSPPGIKTPNTELDFMVDVNPDGHIAGFFVTGALTYSGNSVDENIIMSDTQPCPLTIRYAPAQDLWQIQWGLDIVDCLDTPNPRIRARVDAAGHIQGLEIRDLRTFDAEILNQDLRPAELGVKTG